MSMAEPGAPAEIKVKRKSRLLEVHFRDGEVFRLPFEYLRVYSPSAEVKGHGGGEGKLELAKEAVQVTAVDQVGNYAVRLHFDDGHNSGLYSWAYLYELGVEYDARWARYLKRCEKLGYQRKPLP
jgi:DUF971 family protein